VLGLYLTECCCRHHQILFHHGWISVLLLFSRRLVFPPHYQHHLPHYLGYPVLKWLGYLLLFYRQLNWWKHRPWFPLTLFYLLLFDHQSNQRTARQSGQILTALLFSLRFAGQGHLRFFLYHLALNFPPHHSRPIE